MKLNIKKAFKIFKEGKTDKPVQILYNASEPYDIDKKVAFYTELGYTVTEINK